MAGQVFQRVSCKLDSFYRASFSQHDRCRAPKPGVAFHGQGFGHSLPERWLVVNKAPEVRRPADIVCMAKKEKKAKGKKGASVLETEKPPPPPVDPYTDGDIIMHSLTIIDSYYRCVGKTIFAEKVEISAAAKKLWELPLAVVSHGTEDDPIFNYANKAALEIFNVDWATFTSWPSRETASNEEQTSRNELLAATVTNTTDLKGIVRRTAAGREFRVLDGLLWPLTDLNGEFYGQAAIYGAVEFLDEVAEKDKANESADASPDGTESLVKEQVDAPNPDSTAAQPVAVSSSSSEDPTL